MFTIILIVKLKLSVLLDIDIMCGLTITATIAFIGIWFMQNRFQAHEHNLLDRKEQTDKQKTKSS